MRKLTDRKKSKVAAKTLSALFAFLFSAVFCLSFMTSQVNADSEVVISAVAKQTDIGPGDILIIDVVADRMPGVTEFGPVIFNFDADQAREKISPISSFMRLRSAALLL